MKLHLLTRHWQAQAETTVAGDHLNPREASPQQSTHHPRARASPDLEVGHLRGKPLGCEAELCSLGQKDVPQAGISAQTCIRLALLQG